jgi:hypothetical protein
MRSRPGRHAELLRPSSGNIRYLQHDGFGRVVAAWIRHGDFKTALVRPRSRSTFPATRRSPIRLGHRHAACPRRARRAGTTTIHGGARCRLWRDTSGRGPGRIRSAWARRVAAAPFTTDDPASSDPAADFGSTSLAYDCRGRLIREVSAWPRPSITETYVQGHTFVAVEHDQSGQSLTSCSVPTRTIPSSHKGSTRVVEDRARPRGASGARGAASASIWSTRSGPPGADRRARRYLHPDTASGVVVYRASTTAGRRVDDRAWPVHPPPEYDETGNEIESQGPTTERRSPRHLRPGASRIGALVTHQLREEVEAHDVFHYDIHSPPRAAGWRPARSTLVGGDLGVASSLRVRRPGGRAVELPCMGHGQRRARPRNTAGGRLEQPALRRPT